MSDVSLDAFLGATPGTRRRHVLSVGLLVFALMAAVALLLRFVWGGDSAYYTAAAERDDLTPVFTAAGIVHGGGEMTLTAAHDGVIAAVPGATEGAVRQGQELALFDPAPIARALASDRAVLAESEAALSRAEVSDIEMTTRLDRFEDVWHRSNGRVPALNEMEKARADARRSQLDVIGAKARRDQARLQLQTDQATQADAIVRAPVHGIIVSRRIEQGQYVHRQQPLFILATRPNQPTVEILFAAAPVRSLAIGTRARVQIEGLVDRPRMATVTAIMPNVTGGGQQRAILALDQPEHEALPGMSATVEIKLPVLENVLLVPDAALAFDPGAAARRPCACVYLLGHGDRIRRVNIVAGASDGSRTQILAGGIEPGAQVIIGWRGGPVVANKEARFLAKP